MSRLPLARIDRADFSVHIPRPFTIAMPAECGAAAAAR